MKLKQAEAMWKARTFEDMRSNMVSSAYTIEKRETSKGPDYCVSHWVGRVKISESWPQYTTEFRATAPAY